MEIKDGLGVELIACKGRQMQERALTSFTLHEPYRSFRVIN